MKKTILFTLTFSLLFAALSWGQDAKEEKDLCKQIGPKLVKDGLFFVGIDVIGGKLVEVNVMSPGGITYINKVYKAKRKVEERVIDFLESKVLDKLQALDRRSRLRKAVDEA